jgi:predicted DNA-binding ribbon-helix-helix protein
MAASGVPDEERDAQDSNSGDSTGSSDTRRGGQSTLVSRNVTVSGRRTSMRLEAAMWDALHAICRREGRSLHEMCSLINEQRQESSLTAAIRVFIMLYFRAAATDDGHARAGHGARPNQRPDGDGSTGPV